MEVHLVDTYECSCSKGKGTDKLSINETNKFSTNKLPSLDDYNPGVVNITYIKCPTSCNQSDSPN